MKALGSTTGNSLRDMELAIDSRMKATGFTYSAHEKISITCCNLCGSNMSEWELYAHRDRYGLPVRSMRCKNCGLIFITPRLTEQEYSEFYTKWYRKLVSAFSNSDEEKQAKARERGIEADKTIKFLSKSMPNDFQIEHMLDVGGSTGVFAQKVSTILGCKAVVVDPNKEEIKEALNKGLTCSCCPFTDYNSDTRFNLISMLRTMEHVPDIQRTLSKVKELLAEGGIFLLDIVNHDWLITMFKDRSLATKIDHVYQLTDRTISQYLKIWFPDYEVVKSDTTGRYILYLVKPKC